MKKLFQTSLALLGMTLVVGEFNTDWQTSAPVMLPQLNEKFLVPIGPRPLTKQLYIGTIAVHSQRKKIQFVPTVGNLRAMSQRVSVSIIDREKATIALASTFVPF